MESTCEEGTRATEWLKVARQRHPEGTLAESPS